MSHPDVDVIAFLVSTQSSRSREEAAAPTFTDRGLTYQCSDKPVQLFVPAFFQGQDSGPIKAVVTICFAMPSHLTMTPASSVTVGGTAAARIARHGTTTAASSSTVNPNGPSASNDTTGTGFDGYRNLCEARMRRLERYKKAKSFCSLDSDDAHHFGDVPAHSSNASDSGVSEITEASASVSATSTAARPMGQSAFESRMDLLKQKMIAMMENDVALLQKLVNLGETIQELKTMQKPSEQTATTTTSTYRGRALPRRSSDTSLSSSYGEEDDDWRPLDCAEGFSQSMSAITHLYVEDGDDFDEEDDEVRPNVQYFSRKNSVLRIPIPPRSSNRLLGANRRIARRPSTLAKTALPPPRLLASEDSGHSSSDATPPQQHSPGITDGASTVSSSASSRHSASFALYDIQERVTFTSRRSNASVDSGIRDTASPLLANPVK
uniref:Potassium voltage-gated channel protein eag n=1 Tax=Panagrellus redivivus TaxID=6233 RepID=A0A7E4WB57_PANRE